MSLTVFVNCNNSIQLSTQRTFLGCKLQDFNENIIGDLPLIAQMEYKMRARPVDVATSEIYQTINFSSYLHLSRYFFSPAQNGVWSDGLAEKKLGAISNLE